MTALVSFHRAARMVPGGHPVNVVEVTMNRTLTIRGLVCGLLLFSAASALAEPPTIDYLGYAWEDGGFLPSLPGDELSYTGISTLAHPIFGIQPASEELTFHVTGLISTGEVDLGGGVTMIAYTGGVLELWRDDTPDADWTIGASTFNDGSLFFRGAFSDFTIYMAADGSGAFEGSLDGMAGEIIDQNCSDCAYTWGGAFGASSGAQIPAGYDLQMDGEMSILEAVSNENHTFGSLKALFR